MLINKPIRNIKEYCLSSLLMLLCATLHAQDQKQSDTVRIDATRPVMKTEKKASGTIIDINSKKPLSGARITYGGLSAAITDSLGKFSIQVPDYNVSLRIEADGYEAKEVPLKGLGTISAALYEGDFISVYDNAGTPFHVVPQSHIAGSSATLQTMGNWNNVPETPDGYLQGKIAGVNIIRRSGTPNIGAGIFVRGYSSLYATSQPLVIVDGVFFDNTDFGGSLIAGYYNNQLSFIDTKDIDNITVIKDGTSSYGARGANGVILISTIHAKQEATKIDLGLFGGVNFTPQQVPVLNTTDYRIFLSEMLQSKGLSSKEIQGLPYMNDDINSPDYFANHYSNDWQKMVFKNSSSKNGYLKITGGDNIAKYALSIGFLNSGGIIKGTDLTRYNTRFNADLNLSKRLTATASLSFLYNEQNLKELGTNPVTNPIYASLIKSPFLPTNEVAANGTESPSVAEQDVFGISNPKALINDMQAFNRSYRFMGSVGFNYQLKKNLTLSSIVAITIDKVRQSLFIPRKGVVSDTLADAIAFNKSAAGVTRRIGFFNDTRLSFTRTYNNIHQVAIRAGVRYTRSNYEDDYASSANSATDQLTGVGFGLISLRQLGGSLVEWTSLNTYLNVDYNLWSKYFLSVNASADGSSRFGANAASGAVLRFGNRNYPVFPSVSGAWLISSERFMASGKSIDLLKLRASIGLTGNDDIGNYTNRKYYVGQNLLGVTGLVRGNAANPDLQWETVTKLNAGVDVSLFKERLSISADIYQHTTGKMLVYEKAPAASGLDFVLANSGGMRTRGWEAAVNTRIIQTKELKFDVGFTVAQYKSKITSLPAGPVLTSFSDATIISQVGSAPNLFYGYKTNGVYSSDAIALAEGLSNKNADGSSTPFKGGDIRFVNANGNTKVIDENDRQVIGNPNPDYYGSVNGRLNWKNWTLDALFTFSQGNDTYNYTRRQTEAMSGYANQTEAVINRWKTNGQMTNVPKATWGDPMGNSRFSDRWIEDGSYFRLKTVSVAYNIPLKAGMIKYATVYLNGSNLFTLTKYMGYDPEFSATNSPLGQGVDTILEPQFRSIQAGVKLGL